MYKRDINPIISETMYLGCLALIHRNIIVNENPHLLSFRFIMEARRYFDMDVIAKLLGVSVRHLYRIMETEADYTKNNKINNLIYHWYHSYDYPSFLLTCRQFDIIIKRGDN